MSAAARMFQIMVPVSIVMLLLSACAGPEPVADRWLLVVVTRAGVLPAYTFPTKPRCEEVRAHALEALTQSQHGGSWCLPVRWSSAPEMRAPIGMRA